MNRALRIGLLGLVLVILGACGGDGGTAPTDVNLTGAWTVSLSPIRGYGLDCQVTGLQVQMTHNGTDLSGTYTMQDMACNGQHSGPGGGTIVSGTAINGQLHFHLDDENFDLHGRVTSSSGASGNYTMVITVQGNVYSFTGTWSARR